MQKTKIFFNIINTIFIVLYVFPGSILGFLYYGEFNKQPQLTPDFMLFSSNHVYAFTILSLIGLFAYYKSNKILILNYLIFSSVILDLNFTIAVTKSSLSSCICKISFSN